MVTVSLLCSVGNQVFDLMYNDYPLLNVFSGTGKTMTVNAIAKHLGKKVLLVDFGGLSGRRTDGSGDLDADLRGLFREAQMNNAVLFFDECETVFRNR